MSEEQDIRQLLNDGITAAREGDKERARVLFEEVVAQDPENEKGWFWLASVAATDEERIVYLGNVVQINPGNERAQVLLDRLEAKQDSRPHSAMDEEIIPGVSRRMAIIGGAVGAILIVLICGAIFIAISSNAQRDANERATAAALQATNDAQVAAVETDAAAATQAILRGDITDTPVGPTLPATWTPIPSPTTLAGVTATPLPTAVTNPLFSGRLLGSSGQDILGEGFVNIVQIPLDGSPQVTLVDGRGRGPSLSPQGDRLIYTRFSAGTREQGLEIVTLGGNVQPRLITQILGGRLLSQQDYGSFSPDGNSIAFSAREPGNLNSDVFVVSLTALGGLDNMTPVPDEIAEQALQKLTDGSVNSTAPAWADATRLVYVADAQSSGGGVDLSVINVNGQRSPLTADGTQLIEGNPAVSPDGTRVAFDAYAPGDPDNRNIYIVSMDGGVSLLMVDAPGADMRPRWSPDGQFLAYTSNRSGNWEIYIVDVQSYANYQVTVNSVFDQVNDWLP